MSQYPTDGFAQEAQKHQRKTTRSRRTFLSTFPPKPPKRILIHIRHIIVQLAEVITHGSQAQPLNQSVTVLD
jgi:hypothetical protein